MGDTVTTVNADHLNRHEAEAIARELDPQAGGFFYNAMVRAALKGAERQREKLSKAEKAGGGSWSGLRDRYDGVS
jgi:hypothetical protein